MTFEGIVNVLKESSEYNHEIEHVLTKYVDACKNYNLSGYPYYSEFHKINMYLGNAKYDTTYEEYREYYDDGDLIIHVVHFTESNIYVMYTGRYNSYNDPDWNNDMHQVYPQKVSHTVFVKEKQ